MPLGGVPLKVAVAALLGRVAALHLREGPAAVIPDGRGWLPEVPLDVVRDEVLHVVRDEVVASGCREAPCQHQPIALARDAKAPGVPNNSLETLVLTKVAQRGWGRPQRFGILSVVAALAVCSYLGVDVIQGHGLCGLARRGGAGGKDDRAAGCSREETWHRRFFSLPEGGPVPYAAAAWLALRVWLLFASVAAICAYVEVQTLRRFYWVFFMSFVGCMLPTAGVPVAGGGLYFPLLNLAGLSPKTCVAFVVAAQSVSVGILTPITWLIKDPSVFVPQVFAWSLPGCITGLLLALFAFPLDGAGLLWFFTCCMALLFAYTAHGLFHDLAKQDEVLPTDRLSVRVCLLFAGLLGGIIMGWLGIGCDKLLFFFLTMYGVSSMKASIMGVTLTGILSMPVSFMHLLSGEFPLQLWLLAQPGLLLGSIFGGYLNGLLGSRTVLILFLAIVGFDVVKNFTSLLQHTAVL